MTQFHFQFHSNFSFPQNYAPPAHSSDSSTSNSPTKPQQSQDKKQSQQSLSQQLLSKKQPSQGIETCSMDEQTHEHHAQTPNKATLAPCPQDDRQKPSSAAAKQVDVHAPKGAEASSTKQKSTLSSQTSFQSIAEAESLENSNALDQCWAKVGKLLLESLGQDNFERWFEEVELREVSQEVAHFAVPNSIYPIWIETNYQQELVTAFAAVTGKTLSLKFEVCTRLEKSTSEQHSTELSNANRSNSKQAKEQNPKSSKEQSLPKNKPQDSLFPEEPIDAEDDELTQIQARQTLTERCLQKANILAKFSLDSFVVGESNRYAFAAVSAVADAPAKSYNPLFLHSRPGLGKTHLLHAIGLKVLSRNPRARVLYRTSEQWVNEFLEAIERRSLSAFRARYRNIDVLLLDDVQFLAGKDHCKSEFFHTFNTLFDGHKQIVLSSDRPASEIRDLEPRLRSRFDCGLTAEMEVPNREVRLAILNSKAQHFAAHIKPEILDFLAQRITSDVRTLEGALVRVASYIHITQREPSLSELEHQLRDLLSNCSSEVGINDIQRAVSEYYGVSLTELSSRRRQAQIVYPRQVAMFLARQLTISTLKEIGDAFGGRDHGTVLHAVRKLDDAQGSDRSQLDSDIQEIKRRLSIA